MAFLVAFLFQPMNGFINHELTGVAFELAKAFTIANKVDRIEVAWVCVIGSCEPVIKPVIVEGRFFSFT